MALTKYASRMDQNMIQPQSDKCKTKSYANKTNLYIAGDFGYVPQTLIINVFVFLGLMFVYCLIRMRNWNFGRRPSLQKTNAQWSRTSGKTTSSGSRYGASSETTESELGVALVDDGFFSWIVAMFRIRDHHVYRKCGPDAVQYLSFQRYIILFLIILCIVCLSVILPINILGTLAGTSPSFAHTTISNLEPFSQYLWVHIVLSFALLPVGVILMRHFTFHMKYEEEVVIRRTLMVTNVPETKCSRRIITQHFQEAYPESNIVDMQFAFKLGRLIKYDKNRTGYMENRQWCESYFMETGTRLQMRPYKFNWITACCHCKPCRKVDAIAFYTEKESEFNKKVEDQRISAFSRPLGIVFITFEDEDVPKQIMMDWRKAEICHCFYNPPSSTVSKELDQAAWEIGHAPAPDDIYWQNLSSNTDNWYIRAYLVNFVLIVFLIFFTTPTYILNTGSSKKLQEKLHLTEVHPLITDFIPAILLWLVTVLMPVIISLSEEFVYHWNKSTENLSKMRKIFIFLLFMVVILPSLSLTSAQAFIEFMASIEKNETAASMKWKCIFLPDNGALFVNYVITSAFIGNAAELLRFVDIVLYILFFLSARSQAERATIRQRLFHEFHFGVQYAWMLLNVAVVVLYSIPCPIITPFGLIYLCMKHIVDRYNIYFVYAPSKINKNIHTSAINFLLLTIVLLEVVILFFVFVRRGGPSSVESGGIIVLVDLIGCCLTITAYILHVFCGCYKWYVPRAYQITPGSWRADPDAPLPLTAIPKFIPSALNVRTTPSASQLAQGQDFTQLREHSSHLVNPPKRGKR